MTDRYDTSHLPEDQYEPGSSTVLRNKLGIIDPVVMGEAETNALWRAQKKLIAKITADHIFTADDSQNWMQLLMHWRKCMSN